MNSLEVIRTKRDGGTIPAEILREFILSYARGDIPDYQMAAFLMAVYFRGLSDGETAALTRAMVDSGEALDLGGIPGTVVDKHSTGGVGDKTTLVLAPLVASAGVPVAKMSGRGLGHTGGTIDKLESIPGLRTELSRSEFLDQVAGIGIAVAGQTGRLVPADKKLYALRDATGTVENLSLIASSIVSKKIAAGAGAIVFDVKVGDGAFLKSLDEARTLARTMLGLLESLGRKGVAVLSGMEQPLGRAVGNSVEVAEAIEVLRGEGPGDVRKLSLVLGAHMVVLGGRASSVEEGLALLEEKLSAGYGLDKLREMIEAQGGDPRVTDDPGLLPLSPEHAAIRAEQSGVLASIKAEAVGNAARVLGAGRLTKEDQIDPGAGLILRRKVGDRVEKGEVIAELFAGSRQKLESGLRQLQAAFRIGEPVEVPDLIIGTVK